MLKLKSVVFLLLSFSNLTFAGHSSGSGADRDDIERAAWFLNFPGESPRSVNYCIEQVSEFGVSMEQAASIIEAAFKQWREYMYIKGVNERGMHEPITNIFQLVEECDAQIPLHFYLGVMNPRVKEQYEKYSQPVAFAHKDPFQYSTLSAPGFIWIAQDRIYADDKLTTPGDRNFPQWNYRDNLYAIVLHELGHLFGVGHLDGTIMRRDIWRFTIGKQYPKMGERFVPAFKRKIDHQKELLEQKIQRMGQASNYTGRTNLNSGALFERVSGRGVTGKLNAVLSLDRTNLFLEDDHSKEQLMIVTLVGHENKDSNRIFIQSFAKDTYYYENHTSGNYFGEINFIDARGDTIRLQAVIERNVEDYPMSISIMENFWLTPVVNFDSKY